MDSHESAGESRPEAKATALFIAHGMGQQVRFSTLSDIATGLTGGAVAEHCRPRVVQVGSERVQRMEVRLADGRAVHVYEGYWAPLTEGRVSLRDVTAFLLRAGMRGIRNSTKSFERFLFGKTEEFKQPVRTFVYLSVALLVVLALMVLNASIVLVAAARSPLVSPPTWLTPQLVTDLTTSLNVVLGALMIFLVFLGLNRWARGRDRAAAPSLLDVAHGATMKSDVQPTHEAKLSLVLAVGSFLFLLGTVLAVGVTMLVIFWAHYAVPLGREELWRAFFSADGLRCFNAAFGVGLLALVVMSALGIVAGYVGRIARSSGGWGLVLLAGFLLSLVGLIASAVWLAHYAGLFGVDVTRASLTAGAAGVEEEPSWLLTLATSKGAGFLDAVTWAVFGLASWQVRGLLVQYVGDVAVYVDAHTLDRFAGLRQEIKRRVMRVARAVYAQRRADGDFLYEKVLIVGHSLGSVISYDTLNRLIEEDEVARRAQDGDGKGEDLRVLERTALFLTFGSPLDKTAFVFAAQGKEYDLAREMMATEVQPLIRDARLRRFPWINLYSQADIVSGKLDFYDPNRPALTFRVDNRVDPHAITWLWAHTEYWENPLLFQLLRAHLPDEASPNPVERAEVVGVA